MWFINKVLNISGWRMWTFVFLVVVPTVFALLTWLFMLLEGALGNMFNFRTLGYWESATVVVSIELLVLMFSRKSSK